MPNNHTLNFGDHFPKTGGSRRLEFFAVDKVPLGFKTMFSIVCDVCTFVWGFSDDRRLSRDFISEVPQAGRAKLTA